VEEENIAKITIFPMQQEKLKKLLNAKNQNHLNTRRKKSRKTGYFPDHGWGNPQGMPDFAAFPVIPVIVLSH
jgi:hypothetical protein